MYIERKTIAFGYEKLPVLDADASLHIVGFRGLYGTLMLVYYHFDFQ